MTTGMHADELVVGDAELGAFVRACREVPGMDGPMTTEGRGGPLPALDAWVREWTAKADPAEVSRGALETVRRLIASLG